MIRYTGVACSYCGSETSDVDFHAWKHAGFLHCSHPCQQARERLVEMERHSRETLARFEKQQFETRNHVIRTPAPMRTKGAFGHCWHCGADRTWNRDCSNCGAGV